MRDTHHLNTKSLKVSTQS